MLLLLAQIAVAADEPCYGHTYDNRLEGDNFWVEWEDSTLNESKAANILDAAERARSVFMAVGFPFPDESIVIAFAAETHAAANATTKQCESGPVPHIHLWPGHANSVHIRETVAHELGHAAQYGFMGQYTNAVDSWTWWLEGSAVWLALQSEDDVSDWTWAAGGYLATPEVTLMQGVAAYWDDSKTAHMYGAVLVAAHLEQYASPQAIVDSWEYAGTQGGERIMWPDAIEYLGLDWHDYWGDFLAHAVTADVPNGKFIEDGVTASGTAFELPYSGETLTASERLGWQAIRVSRCVSSRTDTVDVAFQGDPEAQWSVVLVVTEGTDPGDVVNRFEILDVDDTGAASGTITELSAYGEDAWLVASPFDDEPGSFNFSWEMTSPDGALDCEGGDDDIPFSQPPVPETGCGCNQSGGGVGWVAAIVGLLAFRRRQQVSV